MRKLLVALGLVVVLGITALVVFPWLTPWTTEFNLERECGSSPPGDVCVTRMRAMGDVWSELGSLDRAERWYYRAAQQSDVVAMFELGWISETRAVELAKTAAEEMERRSDPNSSDQQSMAELLAPASANDEIHADVANAIGWYGAAADKGFAPAMNNLGQLYLWGLGRQPDMAAAFKWHLAAARAGNPVGCWNVQMAYVAGHGVRRDPVEADKWGSWNPLQANPLDLRWPVLERTTHFGNSIPPDQARVIRAAWKSGSTLRLALSPLAQDPSLPVFHRVEEGGD